MGLFRRAPTPQPRPSADLAPRARDGTYASSTTSSASSSDATSNGSSGQYYARFPLPPSGPVHSASGGAAQLKNVMPPTSSTPTSKKKGIAAGLMQSSTVATPAAAPAAAPAAPSASPWAGYIEPERLNADSSKRFLLSSSKKAREKQRLHEAEELETYFPMGKIELEKLDLRIPTPSPSIRADTAVSFNAGTGKPDADAFPFGAPVSHELGDDGQPRAQRQLAGSWIAVASRQEHVQQAQAQAQAQAQSKAPAMCAAKSGSDFARFSVGNMLDLVDQKMRAEEAKQAQQHRSPQPIVFEAAVVTSTPRKSPAPAFDPSASTSSSPSISSSAQGCALSSSTSSRTSNAPSSLTSASLANGASSFRPSKSSQDDLEILSHSPRAPTHARRQSGHPARSSASSVASQASTLRDEVVDLLELARSRTSSERSRTTSVNGVRGRGSEDSNNGGTRARPNFESLSRGLRNAVGPGARVPSPAPGSTADAGPSAGRGGRPAIPARPAHTRKRSMSVPSAMHVPGWAASATAAGGSPFARQVTVHNRLNGQPRAYDESFFSSPRPPVTPRLQTHLESAETAAEFPAALGSTLPPTGARIQLKRVPSSTMEVQSGSQPAAPAATVDGQESGVRRTAAGHPGAGIAPQNQPQIARLLQAPVTPLAGRAEMEHPHSAPFDSIEGRRFARSPSPSPASSSSLRPTDHRTHGSERVRSNSDASVVDPFPVSRRLAKSRNPKKPTGQERESELLDRSFSPEPEPLRITKLRRVGADGSSSSDSSRSASPSPSPSHTPTARSPLTPVGPAVSIRQDRRVLAAPAPRGHLPAVATGLPVLVSSSGGIGPPPRSPLPLPPPPSEPLPQPPQQQMPWATPSLRPAVSMHALRRDHQPTLAPDLPRRAVSPSGYSREHRPRPQNPPVQLHAHVRTHAPKAQAQAPIARSVHPLPPARPPPPPPLSLAVFASPEKQHAKLDVRSRTSCDEEDAAHPVAARDYAFPPRSDGTRIPLASPQQMHAAHPSLSPRKAALDAFAMRSKRGTTDTVDTIASYYAGSHSSFEPPELEVNPTPAPAQPHHPQDSPQQHQLGRYPSSSTLSSAASRTHSGSHDGSHETHWSASTAITEVDEEDYEHDDWGRVRVPSKGDNPAVSRAGAGVGVVPTHGKSRFGWSRRGPLVQPTVGKSQDEGYLGSPEQHEEGQMRGAVDAGAQDQAYDGRARQRINYTVPARRRPSMDQGF